MGTGDKQGVSDTHAAREPVLEDRSQTSIRPDACQLCGRRVEHLTRHHLIPRMRHRAKRTRRSFARADLNHRIAWLCRPCHSHVHTVLSEKELASSFNTLVALAKHPDIKRFCDWLAVRPASFNPKSRKR